MIDYGTKKRTQQPRLGVLVVPVLRMFEREEEDFNGESPALFSECE